MRNLLALIATFSVWCFAKDDVRAIRGIISVATSEFKPVARAPIHIDLSNFSKGSMALLNRFDGTDIDIRAFNGRVESVTQFKPFGSQSTYLSIQPNKIIAIAKLKTAAGQFYFEVAGKDKPFRIPLTGTILNHDQIQEFLATRNVTIEGVASNDGASIHLIQLTNRASNQTLCELELTGG